MGGNLHRNARREAPGAAAWPHALEWVELERMLWASALTLVGHWLVNRRWSADSLDECD